MKRDQLLETLYKALDETLANVHTATVAKVTAVNGKTINCTPVIARVVEGKSVPLPEFKDVPPVFLRGGGSYTAYPIAVGDYALLIFTERCFDAWYNGAGDGQPPVDYRMHDYSDGFAIVGLHPFGTAIEIPSVIERVGDSEVTGNYDHTGDYILTGNFTINGNLTVNGQGGAGLITMNDTSIQLNNGDITADTISLKEHVHDGVQSGSSNTGEPVP